MQLNRQLDQPINQLRIRQSGGFPQLRIHADGGEARNGVQFVHVNLAGALLKEEIAARHPRAVNRAERSHRIILKYSHLRLRQFSRDQQLRALFQIFRLVIVIFAMRHDFARYGSAHIVVAQHRNLNFAPHHAALHHNFQCKFSRVVHRCRNFMRRLHARHPHRRSQRRPARNGTIGRPACSNSRFCTSLSMPTADASTPAPTYGTPASSINPCTVPSSPNVPCRTGNTTSTPTLGCPAAGPNGTRVAALGSGGSTTRSPDFSTSAGNFIERVPTNQRPSFEIPIGTASYFSGSSARITEAAEASETSCSPERPPKSTPMRKRFCVLITGFSSPIRRAPVQRPATQ